MITAQLIIAALIQALGRVGLKLVTAEFFEAVLSRIIIWAGEKLAPMTSNTLDDELVAEIKRRLEK